MIECADISTTTVCSTSDQHCREIPDGDNFDEFIVSESVSLAGSCNHYWALLNARSIVNKLAELHLFIESNSLELLCVLKLGLTKTSLTV